MEKSNYWFKAKNYGYGWSYPITKEGWIVWVIYFLSIILLITFILKKQIILFFTLFAILSVLFIMIHYKKGEPTKWRWGKEDN